MEHIFAPITLINCDDLVRLEDGRLLNTYIRQVEANAIVDSGSVMLLINDDIKEQLGLRHSYKETIRRKDGSLQEIDVVGPIEVKFKNRCSVGNAWVLPDIENVYLGTIHMLEMDIVIVDNELVFNPLHPDGAIVKLK